MIVRIHYVDDPDIDVTEVDVSRVPAIGEKIGIRAIGPNQVMALDYIIDIRTYYINTNAGTRKPPQWEEEINLLTSSHR